MQQTFADLDGVRLRYVEGGRGEPVVLVHGYMVDLDYQWIVPGVFDRLVQDFHVFAYDNRGHGQSSKFESAADFGLELVRDLIRFIDHIGYERVHVIGYSMGAMIVARAAVDHPDRFCSVTLGGSVGRLPMTQAETTRYRHDAEQMLQGDVTKHILRLWPKNMPAPDREELSRLNRQMLAGKSQASLAAVRVSIADLSIDLSELCASKLPILAVVGTEDPYNADVRALGSMRQATKVVEIVGASHDSAPAEVQFVQEIVAFIAGHLGDCNSGECR